MRQVLVSAAGVVVEDVPAPALEAGRVLVETAFSCISAGTELAGIRAAEVPLWRKVASDPMKAVRSASKALSGGVDQLARSAEAIQRAGAPVGYSASGRVVAVGAGIDDLSPGDRVACAGAGVANHAEVLSVPRNLVARVPDGVPLEDAAATTVAAIALQGIRRLDPTLGETVVVLGLGALGQLAVQLLKANGCRVVAIDVDPARVEVAVALGADLGLGPDEADPIRRVLELSGGVGADGVVVTAASRSDEVMATALSMCRKKGRVSVVGDVGMSLRRADLYEKELDVRMSTSYGPGRYDRRYEDEGLDYPIGHVRWTENRNMQAVLALMAEGKLRVQPLIGAQHPVEGAPGAYASFEAGAGSRPLLVLLRYQAGAEALGRRVDVAPHRLTIIPRRDGALRVALVGPGRFAREVHLPNLRALGSRFQLRAVVARNGPAALSAAREFGAAYAATDVEAVLADPDVDAVVVCTRHHLHAPLVLDALRAGKHVLVEKPLALTWDEVAAIRDLCAAGDGPTLLTGFNRRFSPAATALRAWLSERGSPAVLDYRVNAGWLPPDHWTHGPEGGGRNLGEACHFYDLFRSLVGAPVTGVQATGVKGPGGLPRADENFVAQLAYADGSLASLTYTALGSAEHPKERLTIYAGGRVAELEDYLKLDTGTGRPTTWARPEKGHREELAAFADAAREGRWAVPLEEQLEVTETALRIDAFLTARTTDRHEG